MDRNQKLIVKLLSAAIRNKEVEDVVLSNYEWNEIYEEAKAHDIHALIFPIINELNQKQTIEKQIMQKWQKNALSSSMWQLQLMKEVQNIFNLFHTHAITVLAFKGIVLRDLYPYPELRSMGDADILVHLRDLDKAKNILLGLGFQEGGTNQEHVEFRNKNNIEIELHCSLIGEERFKNAIQLEKTIWENAVDAYIFEAPALVLSQEDHLLYLGLHMAKHMMDSGFGLRQLCDFVLLYEAIEDSVDWKNFFYRTQKLEVERFFAMLFYACEKLFSIQVPNIREFKELNNEKYIKILISEIFEGGIYGYKNSSRNMGSFILRKVKNEKSSGVVNKLKYVKLLLFPSISQMSARYNYAKKNPIFTPVAWMHRLIGNIFRKDFSISDKIYFSKDYNKRTKLLGWLNMR